jgi:hypothetical protein
MLSSPLSTSSERVLSLLYVVAGSVVLSLREASPIGEASRLKLEDESPRRGWGGLGDTSVVVGSEKTSDGVSRSGVKVDVVCSWGGRAGRDLSTLGATEGGFFDFLRRRAMSDS